MSPPRFYIPVEQWNSDAPVLEGDEAHHCISVMRRGVGDQVVVFDGAGRHAQAQIISSNGKRLELKFIHLHQTPPPSVTITLLQAIPKGANMELIIEKAVELGVNEIVPVMTERTVVKLDAKEALKKREKWQRIALETCKQCGQDWLPRVHAPQQFDGVWNQLPAHELRLVAALQPDALGLKAILSSKPQSALIAIGPEGDFTPAEYASARAQGCLPLSLGPIVLRVETAALCCLSVLSYEMRG